METKTREPPFYRKWWFILVMILVFWPLPTVILLTGPAYTKSANGAWITLPLAAKLSTFAVIFLMVIFDATLFVIPIPHKYRYAGVEPKIQNLVSCKDQRILDSVKEIYQEGSQPDKKFGGYLQTLTSAKRVAVGKKYTHCSAIGLFSNKQKKVVHYSFWQTPHDLRVKSFIVVK